MLTLNLPQNGASRFKVLCLGCHADDIEIGCGGTILQWLSSYKDVEIVWVVFSSGGSQREKEARASAELFLEQAKKKPRACVAPEAEASPLLLVRGK